MMSLSDSGSSMSSGVIIVFDEKSKCWDDAIVLAFSSLAKVSSKH
jgi:hypothetical protein